MQIPKSFEEYINTPQSKTATYISHYMQQKMLLHVTQFLLGGNVYSYLQMKTTQKIIDNYFTVNTERYQGDFHV